MFAKCVVPAAFLVTAQARNTFAWSATQDVLYNGARDKAVFNCEILAHEFPNQVLLPGDDAYLKRQTQYWTSQQAELQPACRFVPTNAGDVQTALQIFITRNQTFAVVAGGHSSVTGTSNASEENVVIDLSSMNGIMLEPDEQSVWIGPGARWGDAYALLETRNLTVPGARDSHVGVGGFVLGGGMSWFANRFGWTCDSVLEFDVVTPSLEILKVNALQHADLFFALKGSLGAFGVVTAIKMPTVRCVDVFAGAIGYSDEAMNGVMDAFYALNNENGTAQGYLSFAWTGTGKQTSNVAYLLDMESETARPALLRLAGIPNIHNGLRKTTLKASADEISAGNPVGRRRSKFTLTVSSNKQLNWIRQKCVDIMKTTNFAPDDLLGLTFQPLTMSHLQAQDNFFPLIPEAAPFYIISVEFWWTDSHRDQYFEFQMKNLAEELESGLRAMSELHDFVYPNYAAKWQDPFRGVEKKTKIVLERAKRRYDPENVWRSLVPGIWHV